MSMLVINLSSYIPSATIFSHSSDCFSTFLIVFFDSRKFLILMKSSFSLFPFFCCLYLRCPVQFSRSVVSDSLRPHKSQHARPPCPSPTPGVHPDPRPLEGLMLKLKLQYFGYLMRRVDSLEKTLMLGGIGDRRRKGRQRMRWLDGITDSMDMGLGKSGSW